MGTFDGITIGSSGLNAQRRGVEIAGQNIANVNTQGYTRQRVAITPSAGPVSPAFHSRYDGTGLGVHDVEFERLRNIFLDRRVREEQALGAESAAVNSAYRSLESIFNEPSDKGFSRSLSSFYAAWDDVANRPDDVAARAQLAERGNSLALDLNQLERSLGTYRQTTQVSLANVVSAVNEAAKMAASLQGTIDSATQSGVNANELMDQRDQLFTEIASMIGGESRQEQDGTFSFYVGGVALVRGSNVREIAYQEVAGVSEVVWPLDGRAVALGGEAAGLEHAINQMVPALQASVDAVATEIVTEVNALHTSGFDRNGNPGLDFFTLGPGGIQMNAAILADSDLVAASNAPGTLDGSIARSIAELEGTATVYQEMVVRLGVNSQAAQRRSDLQSSVVQQITMEQESANGVNLDEELADLVRFQRAFEASSRFVSAIDQMLSTLIGGTGRVGL